MAKVTIINEQGFALKNRPNKKFNDATTKKPSIWTFSDKTFVDGKPSGALADCLKELTEAGFKNLTVTIANEELETKQDNKILEGQIESGQKAPRTEAEAEKFDEDYLFKEINHKCAGCNKNCKQSKKATIYQCPQYERVA